jgi:hypothetical protein
MGVHRQENGGSGREVEVEQVEVEVEQVPVVCQIKSDNVTRQGSLSYLQFLLSETFFEVKYLKKR